MSSAVSARKHVRIDDEDIFAQEEQSDSDTPAPARPLRLRSAAPPFGSAYSAALDPTVLTEVVRDMVQQQLAELGRGSSVQRPQGAAPSAELAKDHLLFPRPPSEAETSLAPFDVDAAVRRVCDRDGSFAAWCRGIEWSRDRDKYEARAWASAIDALLSGSYRRSLAVMVKRLAAVQAANEFGWELGKLVQGDGVSSSLLAVEELSKLAKQAQVQTSLRDRLPAPGRATGKSAKFSSAAAPDRKTLSKRAAATGKRGRGGRPAAPQEAPAPSLEQGSA